MSLALELFRMKKFLPALIIAIAFTGLIVIQMAFNGQELGASKLDSLKTKYNAFESVFSQLELKTTQGTKIDFSSIEQPVVLLNFWASWCMPCLTEFESLKKFVDKFPKEKVLVVGINNDDEEPKKSIIKTEKEYNLNFESYSDQSSELTTKFFISKIPATIVFHKGKVIHYSNEESDFMDEDFLRLINKHINK